MKKVMLVFVNREGGELKYVKTFKSDEELQQFVGRIVLQRYVLKEIWYWRDEI